MEPKIGGENRERTPPSTVQFAGKVTGQVTSQVAGQVTGQVEAEQSYFCLLLFHLPLHREGRYQKRAGWVVKISAPLLATRPFKGVPARLPGRV
jgi:hypothetical protein